MKVTENEDIDQRLLIKVPVLERIVCVYIRYFKLGRLNVPHKGIWQADMGKYWIVQAICVQKPLNRTKLSTRMKLSTIFVPRLPHFSFLAMSLQLVDLW